MCVLCVLCVLCVWKGAGTCFFETEYQAVSQVRAVSFLLRSRLKFVRDLKKGHLGDARHD